MVVEIKIPAEAAKNRLLEYNQPETPGGETNQERSIDRPGMSGQCDTHTSEADERWCAEMSEPTR